MPSLLAVCAGIVVVAALAAARAGAASDAPRSLLSDRAHHRRGGDRKLRRQELSVSAVVVDRAGEVIVAMRADGAGPHTMENARRKAYTALSFRTSTTAYAKRYAENNPVVHQQVTLPNVIAIPGGLPVKVGEDVIGGVGVSGSPGVDEPCVQAGLDKVADQLK